MAMATKLMNDKYGMGKLATVSIALSVQEGPLRAQGTMASFISPA